MPNVGVDLSRSPYFDDFDANAQHQQVLFRPGVAVQTRESRYNLSRKLFPE